MINKYDSYIIEILLILDLKDIYSCTLLNVITESISGLSIC